MTNTEYRTKTMDEIVFENRNKEYGAFALRKNYIRYLLISIGVASAVFCLGTASPKIIDKLGLLKKENIDSLKETKLVLEAPPSIKDEEMPPPPPPPPPVELLPPPSVKFIEIQAVEKEKADKEPPPAQEELQKSDAQIGNQTVKGDPNATIPVIPTKEATPPPPDFYDENQVQEKAKYNGNFEEFVMDRFNTDLLIDRACTIEITFKVSKTGDVLTPRITRSCGTELNAEALRVFNMIKKFKPAKINGEPVGATCRVSIELPSREDAGY